MKKSVLLRHELVVKGYLFASELNFFISRPLHEARSRTLLFGFARARSGVGVVRHAYS